MLPLSLLLLTPLIPTILCNHGIADLSDLGMRFHVEAGPFLVDSDPESRSQEKLHVFRAEQPTRFFVSMGGKLYEVGKGDLETDGWDKLIKEKIPVQDHLQLVVLKDSEYAEILR